MNVFFIENDDILTVIVNGRPYTINSSHPNYTNIVNSLQEDLTAEEWESLLDIPEAVNKYFNEKTDSGIEIHGNEIYYNGSVIHNTVCRRIIEFMNRGLPHEPLLNFLNNLMKNPSMKAVDRLYDFLSHHGMAITPDGCFVGYKGVRSDYMSITADRETGEHLDFHIGNVVTMPRNKVDDNEHNACSKGIHVGTYEYATSFCGAQGRVLLVKVNPADAVTVPLNEINKLRCCRLEVLQECPGLVTDPMYGDYDEDDNEDYNNDEDYNNNASLYGGYY